jgi:hypothetical protein
MECGPADSQSKDSRRQFNRDDFKVAQKGLAKVGGLIDEIKDSDRKHHKWYYDRARPVYEELSKVISEKALEICGPDPRPTCQYF